MMALKNDGLDTYLLSRTSRVLDLNLDSKDVLLSFWQILAIKNSNFGVPFGNLTQLAVEIGRL